MEPIEQYLKFNQAYQHFNNCLFDAALPGAFITLQTKGGGFGYYAKDRFRAINGDSKMDEIALNPDYFFYGEKEVLQTLVHEMCHQWQKHLGSPSRSGYHNKEWAEKMGSVGLMPTSTGYEGGKKTGQNIVDYAVKGGPFDKAADVLLKKENIIDWSYFSWESYQLQIIKSINGNVMTLESTERVKEGALITVGQSTAMVDMVHHDENTVDFHMVSGPGITRENTEAFIKVPISAKKKNKIKYTCPGCGLNVWGKPQLKVVCFECDLMLTEPKTRDREGD